MTDQIFKILNKRKKSKHRYMLYMYIHNKGYILVKLSLLKKIQVEHKIVCIIDGYVLCELYFLSFKNGPKQLIMFERVSITLETNNMYTCSIYKIGNYLFNKPRIIKTI